MNIQKKINKPFTYWFFLLAGIVFLLTITRHFLFESKAEPMFYYFEIISFIVFMVMLLLTEKQCASFQEQIRLLNETYKNDKTEWQNKILDLQNNLSVFEKEEKEVQGMLIKQETIIKQVFDNKSNKKGNTSFLYLFSEATHASAAILYKETKPSGGFIVQDSYGLPEDFSPQSFERGEGLCGQTVIDGVPLLIEDIPDDYFMMLSGLGKAKPKFIYFLPVMDNNNCIALIELATFKKNDLEKMWQGISTKIIDKGIL